MVTVMLIDLTQNINLMFSECDNLKKIFYQVLSQTKLSFLLHLQAQNSNKC